MKVDGEILLYWRIQQADEGDVWTGLLIIEVNLTLIRHEYAELINDFMSVVKQKYGEMVLIQFQDFANLCVFDLLAKYNVSHLLFTNDI